MVRNVPVDRSALPSMWYSCTTDSCPSGSQTLSRNMASICSASPSDQTSMRRARRMAMVGMGVELVPTQRISGIVQGVRMGHVVAVRTACRRETARPTRRGSQNRCPACRVRAALHALAEAGQLVHPAMKTKPAIRVHRPGRRAGGASACRPRPRRAALRDGGAQVAAGREPTSCRQPGRRGSASMLTTSRSDRDDVEIGLAKTSGSPWAGVRRSRARPFRCRSVPARRARTSEWRTCAAPNRAGGAAA